MRRMNLSEDYKLGSLSRVIEAVTLTYQMESVTKRRLLGHVKAIRLYVEAGERAEAQRLLSELESAVRGEEWEAVVIRHCDKIKTQWNVEEKR